MDVSRETTDVTTEPKGYYDLTNIIYSDDDRAVWRVTYADTIFGSHAEQKQLFSIYIYIYIYTYVCISLSLNLSLSLYIYTNKYT